MCGSGDLFQSSHPTTGEANTAHHQDDSCELNQQSIVLMFPDFESRDGICSSILILLLERLILLIINKTAVN